ncbi:MAG: hypothetical protein EHM41_19310 [Chloroflexi bacterium]|nr:MAG: hypothetical protein EHM41_19310 [Chloroflexota bacterium]
MGAWLTLAGFGAYHGLNPGMGWLFALALGLQQSNPSAIWKAMIPITIGHAGAIALAAAGIVILQAFISVQTLQLITAVLLIAFGVYKLFNWYRHPRWTGMKVGWYELVWWSFLMAMAHGAGLMIAPAILNVTTVPMEHGMHQAANLNAVLGVGLHTFAMLATMAVVAWLVYKKLGLMVLRQSWFNFDLVWAVALLIVGSIAFVVTV